MALSLTLATGVIRIKVDRSQFDPALAQIRRDLAAMPSVIPVRFVANVSQLTAGISRAQAGVTRLRNAAASPIRFTGNPWELHRSIGQIEGRLARLQRMANLNFGGRGMPGGGGGGGRFGGMGGVGGFGAGLMSGVGMGTMFSPQFAAGEAITGAMAGGIKTAIDFEQAFATLGRVSGFAAPELAKLKEQLFAISIVQPGVGIHDLIEMATIGARAGVADKGGLKGLTDFAEALAKVKLVIPEMGTEELSNGMVRLLNNFKLGTEYTEGLGSALTALDNISTASAADILEISTALSGTARSIGMTIEDTLSLSSTLKDVGLSNQLAAGSFQQIFRSMASNSHKFAEQIGIDAKTWADAYRQGPMIALKLVIDKMNEMKDTIKGQEFLASLGLRGQRSGGSIQMLASQFEKVSPRSAIAGKEFKTGESLAKAQEKMDTTGAALVKLANAALATADALGTPLLGPIKALADNLTWLAGLVRFGGANAGKVIEQTMPEWVATFLLGTKGFRGAAGANAQAPAGAGPGPLENVGLGILRGVMPKWIKPGVDLVMPAPALAKALPEPPKPAPAVAGAAGGGPLVAMLRGADALQDVFQEKRIGLMMRDLKPAMKRLGEPVADLLFPAEGSERGKLLHMIEAQKNQRAQVFEGGESMHKSMQEALLNDDIGKQQLAAQKEMVGLLGILATKARMAGVEIPAAVARLAHGKGL